MLVHLLPLAALLSGVALLLLGSGLLTTLLAVRGGAEGFGSPFMGLLGSMFFAGFLVGTHVAPRVIRRVGHVRAFAFFTSAVACAVLLHELLVVPWVWALVRLLTGISMVGLYTIVESWLNSQAAPAQRARVFSVYMGVNLGALALSQQLLHLGPASGHVLFGLAALLVSAAVMPVAATRLHQPVLDAERGYVLAPMQRGLRLTTGAEFAPIDAPPTPVQLAKAEVLARELVELGEALPEPPWFGARPCTADMLPVMGPAPRHTGLWFNFGHAHQGFTLGPVAGRLLAEMVSGGPTGVDPGPYRAARFG